MEESLIACEDEIDLRELALTLWRGKWVIIFATLGMAVVALLISLALPKQYEASASLVITQPKIQQKGQEGLLFVAEVPDLKTIATLARSAAVFQALAADPEIQTAWNAETNTPLVWQTLAGKGSVSSVGKNGLQLKVKDTDPQRAALIANRWAAQVAKQINATYGIAATVSQMTATVEAANRAYQAAEKAYTQALAQDRQAALSTQLERVKGDLSCVLARRSNIQRLQIDLRAFSSYLQNLSTDATLTPGDVLAFATLQQRVLATKICMADTTSIQTQWQATGLTTLTVSQALARVKEMQSVLEARAAALPDQQSRLEEQIRQLQQALEKESARLREIKSQRDTAWSVYHALAHLQAQGKALDMSVNKAASVSAQAVAPTRPSSPHIVMNVALAAVLGAMLGVVGVFVAGWWKDATMEAK